MQVKVYYASGNIEAISPTILSYSDGILLEDDKLHVDGLYTQGLRYTRCCLSTDPDSPCEVLREEMVIIPPEALEDVLMVLVDDSLRLVLNLETGLLEDVEAASVRRSLERYRHGQEGPGEGPAEDGQEDAGRAGGAPGDGYGY